MDNLLSVVLGFVMLVGIFPVIKVVKMALGSYYSILFNEEGMAGDKLTTGTEVIAGFAHENSFVQIRGPTFRAGKEAIGSYVRFHIRKTYPKIHSG
ncbi:hypothetical protein [Thalassobacillus devorans]|uniref:hypothetical protein n=1 Tax=Thalassobacillus devorans TaxID=279813 RepID=UPI00048AC3A7|nr:hypothetical protein [Thalassobacillus devorans]